MPKRNRSPLWYRYPNIGVEFGKALRTRPETKQEIRRAYDELSDEDVENLKRIAKRFGRMILVSTND